MPYFSKKQHPPSALLPVTTRNDNKNASRRQQQPQPQPTKKPGCCNRLRAEAKHPAFSSHEVITGHVLDGPASFAPSGSCPLFVKTVVLGVSVSVVVDGLLFYDPTIFYLAFLTNCSLLLTVAYLFSSWVNTALASVCGTRNNTQLTFLHKVTWGLFALVAPAEIVVTVGYWAVEWDGSPS